MEQIRSIWVVRNGVGGASLVLGSCVAVLGHGSWPHGFFLSSTAVELIFGPLLTTSWTLLFLHGSRRLEDSAMNFTSEERRERAYSSRGPLGFAIIALFSGVGYAVSAALVNLLDWKGKARAARPPSAVVVSFVTLY
jgi:hypothetical protein